MTKTIVDREVMKGLKPALEKKFPSVLFTFKLAGTDKYLLSGTASTWREETAVSSFVAGFIEGYDSGSISERV